MSKPESLAPVPRQSTGLGCLMRLGWLVIGHGLIFLSALFIYECRGGFVLSARDVVFWAAVAACLVVRYLDVTYFHGLTASGEPATTAHWRRYAVILLLVAAALWGGVHAATYYQG